MTVISCINVSFLALLLCCHRHCKRERERAAAFEVCQLLYPIKYQIHVFVLSIILHEAAILLEHFDCWTNSPAGSQSNFRLPCVCFTWCWLTFLLSMFIFTGECRQLVHGTVLYLCESHCWHWFAVLLLFISLCMLLKVKSRSVVSVVSLPLANSH